MNQSFSNSRRILPMLFLFALQANAGDGSGRRPHYDYCTEPHYAICHNTDIKDGLEMERPFEDIMALAKQEIQFNQLPNKLEVFFPIASIEKSDNTRCASTRTDATPKRSGDTLKSTYTFDLNTELSEIYTTFDLAKKAFTVAGQKSTQKNLLRMRDLMIKTVDRVSGNRPESKRMKQILDQVQIVGPDEIRTLKIGHPELGASLEDQLGSKCLAHSIEPSSVPFTSRTGVNYLILCPAWLISNSIQPQESDSHLDFTIGTFAQAMADFLPWDYPVFQRLPGINPIPSMDVELSTHYSEKTDTAYALWIREVLATTIASFGPKASPERKKVAFIRSIGQFCSRSSSRITEILGKSPAYQEGMGCKKP